MWPKTQRGMFLVALALSRAARRSLSPRSSRTGPAAQQARSAAGRACATLTGQQQCSAGRAPPADDASSCRSRRQGRTAVGLGPEIHAAWVARQGAQALRTVVGNHNHRLAHRLGLDAVADPGRRGCLGGHAIQLLEGCGAPGVAAALRSTARVGSCQRAPHQQRRQLSDGVCCSTEAATWPLTRCSAAHACTDACRPSRGRTACRQRR